VTVEDIMTRDVITVSPATPIHEAASLMVEHRVSNLPVIDAEGRLVGIVSRADLIRALAVSSVRGTASPPAARG
jgi:CBS domain-containing protein